jgi:hypothetical protein
MVFCLRLWAPIMLDLNVTFFKDNRLMLIKYVNKIIKKTSKSFD